MLADILINAFINSPFSIIYIVETVNVEKVVYDANIPIDKNSLISGGHSGFIDIYAIMKPNMNEPVELAINVDKVFAPLGSKNNLFNPNRDIVPIAPPTAIIIIFIVIYRSNSFWIIFNIFP